ncbi:MAG: phosphotransferase [Micavibrio aeruginosavorus]|uniref:Phosphotransferase n=1 Tax=Micavibrio aeruginosavorus TaxID=349221 RepID=A0A2W5FKI1_9BACT|nr:MAG: phosphotransferase [Micavibrio aeruginosavorus]
MFNEDWKTEFLSREGWLDAAETHAGDDWALRKFSRLSKGGANVILMQSLPDDHPRATLGHKVEDYVRIAKYLRDKNFPAPDIFAEDVPHGLLLLQDFGDISLHEIIRDDDAKTHEFYIEATKLLLRFYRELEPGSLDLPNYFDSAIYKGRRRLMDWYYPAVTGQKVTQTLMHDYMNAWGDIEKSLPSPVMKFSHADYHPHNLMIKDGKIGLIDFQGAIWAPAPYDLVNLLEDARRIVPDNIKKACLKIFEDNLDAEEWQNFKEWYDVLTVQFHARVIGQAVRLAVKENKTRLLDYIPNLKKYLAAEIQSPLMQPLKEICDKAGLDFTGSTSLNLSPDLFALEAF